MKSIQVPEEENTKEVTITLLLFCEGRPTPYERLYRLHPKPDGTVRVAHVIRIKHDSLELHVAHIRNGTVHWKPSALHFDGDDEKLLTAWHTDAEAHS